ncbi:MAG: IS66 family insertion sequence element accessory protein TnpB, partial [Candidatus Obscuribacterales bacterium]
ERFRAGRTCQNRWPDDRNGWPRFNQNRWPHSSQNSRPGDQNGQPNQPEYALSGSLFVFRNRRADKIKLLYFDRDGLAIWYKSLQKGTFRFPDLSNISSAGVEIDASTLRLILDGIELRSIHRHPRFRINEEGQVEHLVLRDVGLSREPQEPL